jgi:tetratricopeptide (TPR) repeat protein
MENVRFVFSELIKTLALAFLALLAARAVGSLRTRKVGEGFASPWVPRGLPSSPERKVKRLAVTRGLLYLVILALVIVGARNVGDDVAAEFYYWASQTNVDRSQSAQAYVNALQAVRRRPGVVRYWRMLARTKYVSQQYTALLEDRPVFESLSGGHLEEEDALRFAFCYFALAQYDKVIPLMERLIRENRFYAAPYVLQGMTYMALKKYASSERSFLEVLQIFPSHRDAVEGLAHVYFLMGDPARALAVLNETARYPFSQEARGRFEALRDFYAQ